MSRRSPRRIDFTRVVLKEALSGLSRRLRDSVEYRRLEQELGRAERLPLPAAAWVAELLSRDLDRPLLVVVPHESDALAWLQHFGNPYAMNIADLPGRTAIDLGVYAAPESFLVDPAGYIVFKQIGAVTPEVIENEILPRVREMGTKSP